MKYFALGIHENYIPNGILKEVNENADIDFITYEDIFIRQEKHGNKHYKMPENLSVANATELN